MFTKALFATDLSPASDAVIDCMEGLRSLGTSEILLLHAVFVHAHYPETYDTEDTLRKASAPKLDEQRARLQTMGFQVTAEMVVGSPPRVILEYAEQQDVSVIVVGSHGASLQRDILLGSVANEVVHRATRPVLVVRHKILEDAAGHTRCEAACTDLLADVLHPTDFSDIAERAFTYAEKMVASGVKRVRLLHVQDRAKLTPHLAERLPEFDATDVARLRRLKDRLCSLGQVNVAIEVTQGFPAPEIVRRASGGTISLIVMGSQGRGFIAEVFLGSVAHNVVRLAAVPVLLIPPHQVSGLVYAASLDEETNLWKRQRR